VLESNAVLAGISETMSEDRAPIGIVATSSVTPLSAESRGWSIQRPVKFANTCQIWPAPERLPKR
jgi:hypothetical protein